LEIEVTVLTLTEFESDVLNAMADDIENLEQIYKSLALEFSPENYQSGDVSAFYWRQREPQIFLADIADALTTLTRKGLLTVRLEDGQAISSGFEYAWQGWFGLTQLGRAMLIDYNESHGY
jgi:hypothetical protein